MSNVEKITAFWKRHIRNRPLGLLLFLLVCLYLYFGIYQPPDWRHFLDRDGYLETFESAYYGYALDFSDPWTQQEFYPPERGYRGVTGQIGLFNPNSTVWLRHDVPDFIQVDLLTQIDTEDLKDAVFFQLYRHFRSDYKSIEFTDQDHFFRLRSTPTLCYETYHVSAERLFILRMCAEEEKFEAARRYFEIIDQSLRFEE